jgi:hypothetical protein
MSLFPMCNSRGDAAELLFYLNTKEILRSFGSQDRLRTRRIYYFILVPKLSSNNYIYAKFNLEEIKILNSLRGQKKPNR